MASSSSSSSSSTHQWKYDVFISFRGEDTRKGFTDHLHAALRQKGIRTFMDDRLRRGEQISPALLKAIEESRFSIVILSDNYASSSWCLDELVKIVDCIRSMGHAAIPVFYRVDPSDVKKQRGSFVEAFAKHEQIYREKMEKVVKWRKALTEVATISGWHSQDRHEAKLIEEIVRDVWNKLVGTSSSDMKGLVGMESRIEAMNSLLYIGSLDVRMVGIWGMAGVGKTTIAKAIYERIYAQFEGYCFLSNVREESNKLGLPHLQMELVSQILKEGNPSTRLFNRGINFIKDTLRSMKVLIILDDVDQRKQLQDLVGDHDWFGPGSRIIITTRDRHLLKFQDVDEIYEAKELAYDEALKLFCQCAFRYKHSTEDFMQVCHNAVNNIGGLPLALEVLGSSLYTKSIDVWKSELHKLKQFPNKEVQNVLKTSFDGLDKNEQNIFLDIAFFYKGHDKDSVGEILDSCGFFFSTGIKNLEDKSLITISKGNRLCMHDLLQEMGWEIVKEKSEVLGGRSRLRLHEDIDHALTTNKGTEVIEGISLDLSASEELNFSIEAFVKMTRLRLLRFSTEQIDPSLEYLSGTELKLNSDPFDSMRSKYARRRRHYKSYCYKLHLCGDFKFLSNELRSLHWDGFPLKSLPSSFHPEKLVELNMCFSQLKQLWQGKKAFEKLKFVKLSHSQHLTKTPDFSGAPNLERLILEGCTSLVEVHSSIGALKKLIFLNLEGCKKLTSFPSCIHMPSLQILTLSGCLKLTSFSSCTHFPSLKFLSLSGCLKLKQFPEVQGNMEHLPELSLKGTAIKGLPSSIEYLTGLALLNLKECKSLESLPSSIFKLKSLKTLILSNCGRLEKLPEIQENIESLEKLFLDGSAIRELPSSIGCLNGLVLLNLENCKKLASLPQSICELTSLRTLTLSGCLELKGLPDVLGGLQYLAKLNADGSGIQEVPPSINFLTNLEELSLAGCKGGESKSRNLVLSFRSSPTEQLRLPCLSGLCFLRNLNLSDCNLLEGALPSDFSSLFVLEMLDLSRNRFITIPGSLSGLPWLKTLILAYCKSLQSLPELPSNIQYLDAKDCASLETFSCSSSTYTSETLGCLKFDFSNCFRLMENDTVKHILLGIQLLASIPILHSYRASLSHSLRTLSIYGGPTKKFDAIVPGSRIPEWFVDQNTGSSVTVELPPHWFNTKLVGMAVCAVVDVKGVIDPIDPTRCPRIHFTVDDGGEFWSGWAASPSHSMKADHMWFGYESTADLVHVSGDDFSRERGNMVVSFRFSGVGKKLEVKKCGVRLVYEGEEKDSQCRFPHGTILTTNYESDSESDSDSEPEDLRQSNSDSESNEFPYELLPGAEADLCSPSNSVYLESESEPQSLPSSFPM